ncbi:O-acetyl-ADP-ribose deacetylase [uncultured Enterococcus sp.]|uniref:O-acetyl-ADP-ribose deacetylase n=1 Tax=uncultured Enterococcus sp. TaxID=167972 RepID=UPI002AA86396|nr:O-acetyl-ADP-ribose deacetylase [uncultured Enterococcus sp.]
MMKIKLILGDITTLSVDAIVNAANSSLLGGGGVDGAIHRAAGKQLVEECRTLNGCRTGEAKLTKGYDLPADYVIHTVGPVWNGGSKNEQLLLQNCYLNSLSLAAANNIQTIAFPCISTGRYRFPLRLAAETAVTAIVNYSKKHNDIDEVIFSCNDRENYRHYSEVLEEVKASEVTIELL